MSTNAQDLEPAVRRRSFPSWSIVIPQPYVETLGEDGKYWHAFGENWSVSMTSYLLSDDRGSRPSAEMIATRFLRNDGVPVLELPPGLIGDGAELDAVGTARASRMLQGMLAADGCALIITITSDDRAWARRTWLSIRHHTDARPA